MAIKPRVLVLLLVVSCAVEVPNTPPGTFVVARFDPSAAPAVVPTPTDLVANPVTGLLSVPVPADASAADKWFYDWLNTLNGFPAAATAVATFTAPLDAATITASTVRVFDMTTGHATVEVSRALTETTAGLGQLTVSPPMGGWLPGHRYAVAVLGGVNGVRGKDGTACVGSATWALVRTQGELIDCPNDDLASNDCRLVSELVPSTVTEDASRRLADQLATAKRLEAVRRKYTATLDVLSRSGVPRSDVALLWTFRIDDSALAVFDPSASPARVPSPSDLAIRQGVVTVPIDGAASPATQEWTRTFINTLDGYPVSSVAGLDVAQQAIDPATLSPRTVRVFALTGTPLTGTAAVSWNAQLRRLVVAPPAGGWGAGRRIAVAVLGGSNGVRAVGGHALVGSQAWALVRSATPLVDCAVLGPACNSFVKAAPISTTQAIALESLRRSFAPALDALEREGVARRDVAAAWTFTTTEQPEVVFDLSATSPRVPLPNDLFFDTRSGLMNQPVPNDASPASREFITDYLNTLDGVLPASVASASFGGSINPATVTNNTVRVRVVSGPPLVGSPAITTDLVNNRVVVTPPAGGWGKGRTISIAVLGGSAGVQSMSGKALTASLAFSYARLSSSLLDGSRSVTALSDAQAGAIEPLRRALSSEFDALEATGIQRQDVAALWTFRTMSHAEVSFDPQAGVVPFPNNHQFRLEPDAGALADGGVPGDDVSLTARVSAPVWADAGVTLRRLHSEFATLDGFSTTAPILSEMSQAHGALDRGVFDAGGLSAAAGLVKLEGPDVLLADGGVRSNVVTVATDGGVALQWIPTSPLDEGSRFAAYVTNEARSDDSKQVRASLPFALVRLRAPLVDSFGASTIPSITQSQAAALEPLRRRFSSCLDRLETKSLSRRSLALAFCFTTQRPSTTLTQLTSPTTATEPNWVVDRSSLKPTLMAAQLPVTNIGAIVEAELPWPDALTGSNGTLSTPWRTNVVRAVISLPSSAAPSSGFPVVVFQHGLGHDRTDVFFIANALNAEGLAVIAIDAPLHGERSDCRRAAIPNDACATPATCDATTGRCVAPTGTTCTTSLDCVATNEGRCLSTGRCEGGSFSLESARLGFFRAPLVSGRGFFEPSVATRDRLFHAGALDVAQLERVLRATGSTSLNGRLTTLMFGSLDGSRVTVAGQQLGALSTLLHGASATGSRSLVAAAVSNDALESSLHSTDWFAALAAEGIQPNTAAFDVTQSLARAVLDGASPRWSLGAALASQRRVFVPYIDSGPPPLLRAVPNTTRLSWFQFQSHTGMAATGRFPASWPVDARADFWLNPGGLSGSANINAECDASSTSFNATTCATNVAQRQVAQFLSSGSAPQNTPVTP